MNKFCRKFYGYVDRSNNYRYTYRREGFIEKFPHIKPLRGVLIVRKEDSESIVTFLKEFNADILVRSIVLTEDDMKKLKIKNR
jgi:hypothetical protein